MKWRGGYVEYVAVAAATDRDVDSTWAGEQNKGERLVDEV